MDLLLAANEQAVDGVLYPGHHKLRHEARHVFSALLEAGEID
jgi:hypothetical protein